MIRKRNKPNGYPLPDRTVIYSRKKHMMPIPEEGKMYHCFDDGKISFSRHYIVSVYEVLEQMAFKKRYSNDFKQWLKETKRCYWLYARSTDKFVVIKDSNAVDHPSQVFVRTKQGGWFSFSRNYFLSGRLDITGKLWDYLVAHIDDYDYSDEEKKTIIEEGTI